MDEMMGKVENLLFASGDSMSISELAEYFEMDCDAFEELILEEIARREKDKGLLIRRFENRIQLSTRAEYAPMLFQLLGERQHQELTRSMMEALSIVAYRQPVTRAEVEELRGVNSSYILNALVENGMIREAGRKQAIGAPVLYATTEKFLRHFGFSSLADLPPLPENAGDIDNPSTEE